MDSELLIDILLWAIYLVLTAALALAVWSAFRSLKVNKRAAVELGIKVRWIRWSVGASLATCLAITALLADNTPIIINGEPYNDPFWLRISDMLIASAIVLIVVAAICTLLAWIGVGRRKKIRVKSRE